ncbi:hypothetical protein B0A49_12903 [Cryomyces minteri]|uniref:Plus3 domain-containing protein n=1 Tax=Cryomyces minteri TaxID=331657 RepID=A0A4U0W7N4_9PEZI|nr:hypothetical protein B0A49_12903 [Cryomyces minteri]
MSDNELDAELLALAGDDSSSDEEETKPTAKPSRSVTPASSPTNAAEEKGRSPIRRGVAQKTKVKASKGGARKRRKEESEEEGEASSAPASPNSLGSGAMSESESDTAPANADEESVGYPLEGKYADEADKARIMAMSEIQREELLAERAAEIERKTQDLHLRRLLQARERDEARFADKKKRKAGAAELEDSSRKSSRLKVKASEPLEAYKRHREQKGEQRRREDDRRRDRRSMSREDGHSDADADGESEVEWDDGKTKLMPSAHEELLADIKDFERVRVGRTNFAKVCFYPTFNDAISGCFCRVSIGIDRSNGQNMYRMTQIKGFAEGRPYAMEGHNGKSFITDQYAVVVHGSAEKEYPFIACSDSKFTEAEYERYKKAMIADTLKPPTKAHLASKLDDIHRLLNHQWTEEDIQAKIKRSGALQAKFASFDREKIAERRKQAVAREDEAAIAKCDQELAAIDGPKLAFGTSLNSTANKAPKGQMQQERLAALNRANRKANTEEIRKAQLAEKRASQKARMETAAKMKKKEEESKIAKKIHLSVVDDLFGDGSDISRAATPMTGTDTPNKTSTPRSSTPANGVKPERKAGIPTFKKKDMDDDLIASMDLGIDIDIDI